MINELKNKKGITLIALVITIIVLLILAGVAIATLIGDNGLLGKASGARDNNNKSTADEHISMLMSEYIADKISENKSMNDFLQEKVTKGQLSSYVDNQDETFIVEYNGYEVKVDSEGKILEKAQIAGPKPKVNSVTVKLEDGTDIPNDGAELGSKLKVILEVSMEDGTVEETSLGTLNNTKDEITYTTNGTEKKIEFTIIGQVANNRYSVKKEIDLADYYELAVLSASDVKNRATKCYGGVVSDYTCTGTGVTKWRIFHSDGTNIYLISDDYLTYNDVKDIKRTSGMIKYGNDTSTLLYWPDNYDGGYSGSAWIIANSLAKKWMDEYFNYTPDNGVTYPNRTTSGSNMKAIAHMMDTGVWDVYASNKTYADWAIAGPTLEMYMQSYKASHPSFEPVYGVNQNGYTNWQTNYYLGNEGIYNKPNPNNQGEGAWLIAPVEVSGYNFPRFGRFGFNNGRLDWNDYNNFRGGIRPVVCLNQSVNLTKVKAGEYTIAGTD